MHIRHTFYLHSLMFICGCAILATSFACHPKNEKSDSTVFEEKPLTTVVKPAIAYTSTKSSPTEQPTSVDAVKPVVKPTPKNCQPDFTLIGKPKGNRYIYYVTGFNAGEFKCWAELENHGQKICKGEPCTIYYIDSPKASINTTPPHFVDPSILKEHGIGQFEHTNHWWEVKGAKLWGKTGKEFAYYNTNNNSGG